MTNNIKIDYNRVCSHCKYSIYNEEYKDTVPSIHTCYNIKSEYYLKPQAWCSTCDKFKPEKDLDEGQTDI